jgi:hypothetical protein
VPANLGRERGQRTAADGDVKIGPARGPLDHAGLLRPGAVGMRDIDDRQRQIVCDHGEPRHAPGDQHIGIGARPREQPPRLAGIAQFSRDMNRHQPRGLREHGMMKVRRTEHDASRRDVLKVFCQRQNPPLRPADVQRRREEGDF